MNDEVHEFRPIDRSKHELLIVDDDPASRYATVRVLRAAGFRIREASSGLEGLRLADDSISAMVIDIHLPDIDGFELCRRLRSQSATSRMPVLHLTAAFVTDEDKVRGLDGGADAYLTHPAEPAVLVATVQALVRTRVAEDAMRRSEAKFRAIYAQAPGGIALLDQRGRFIDANPSMLSLLDREFDTVSGHAVSEFVLAESVDRVNDFTRNVSAVVSGVEFQIITPDGRVVHLECSVSPHVDPGGTLLVAMAITGRVALEQQRIKLLEREQAARNAAEQLSRMKDDFIAVLSHELRTPLSAISGWTHVLQRRGAGDEQTKLGLAAIERNVLTQARMISDLLDMSRLNLGKLPLSFETLDPSEAVTSAMSAMQVSIEDKKIQIDLQLAPAYRPIRADSSRLQQVIWNLLTNAIKFSPLGGTIAVRLIQDESGLTLRVRDAGRGIPADFLPFVFDRFAQNESASNRRTGGLGLGLSIAKQLVEAHGGTITAMSDGEGLGATFEVWLPRNANEEQGTEMSTNSTSGALESLEAEAAVKGLHVLVVDDDRDANAMLKLILSERGAVVQSAFSFGDALEKLDSLTPDLLISDIGMPGKDGYTLIAEVRRREAGHQRHIPSIALTAFSRSQDINQAMEAGYDAHCAKPLRPLQLFRQIQLVLQKLR
ncbi:MAG: response regulator [Rhizobacter sp.]